MGSACGSLNSSSTVHPVEQPKHRPMGGGDGYQLNHKAVNLKPKQVLQRALTPIPKDLVEVIQTKEDEFVIDPGEPLDRLNLVTPTDMTIRYPDGSLHPVPIIETKMRHYSLKYPTIKLHDDRHKSRRHTTQLNEVYQLPGGETVKPSPLPENAIVSTSLTSIGDGCAESPGFTDRKARSRSRTNQEQQQFPENMKQSDSPEGIASVKDDRAASKVFENKISVLRTEQNSKFDLLDNDIFIQQHPKSSTHATEVTDTSNAHKIHHLDTCQEEKELTKYPSELCPFSESYNANLNSDHKKTQETSGNKVCDEKLERTSLKNYPSDLNPFSAKNDHLTDVVEVMALESSPIQQTKSPPNKVFQIIQLQQGVIQVESCHSFYGDDTKVPAHVDAIMADSFGVMLRSCLVVAELPSEQEMLLQNFHQPPVIVDEVKECGERVDDQEEVINAVVQPYIEEIIIRAAESIVLDPFDNCYHESVPKEKLSSFAGKRDVGLQIFCEKPPTHDDGVNGKHTVPSAQTEVQTFSISESNLKEENDIDIDGVENCRNRRPSAEDGGPCYVSHDESPCYLDGICGANYLKSDRPPGRLPPIERPPIELSPMINRITGSPQALASDSPIIKELHVKEECKVRVYKVREHSEEKD